MKKQNGFTLIEMMLVITVIAIIAALAVTTYRRHAETARINKVAVEMQHVLEAALAYSVDNNKWPNDNKDPSCATQPSSSPEQFEFINNYIPNQDVQSSFGSHFCWSSAGDQKRLFWVALKVPHHEATLAKRIAAHLPNAVVTADFNAQQPCVGNVCYVRAEVVQPGVTSNNAGDNHGMVVATGDCPSHNDPTNSNAHSSTCTRIPAANGTRYRINFDACSDNDLARVVVFPNFINFPRDNYPGFTIKNIDAERTIDACTMTVGIDGKKKQHCDISVHATTCVGTGPFKCGYLDIANARHPGSIGASYLVACVPKNT